jgi:hypothetical protein
LQQDGFAPRRELAQAAVAGEVFLLSGGIAEGLAGAGEFEAGDLIFRVQRNGVLEVPGGGGSVAEGERHFARDDAGFLEITVAGERGFEELAGPGVVASAAMQLTGFAGGIGVGGVEAKLLIELASCPEECLPHADAIALGDGVPLWPRILADLEAGKLHSTYSATYDSDYRRDLPPRCSILPRHSFLTTTSLIATRGCHNRCGFCYLATDGLRMP